MQNSKKMIFRLSFLFVICTIASTDAIVSGLPTQRGQFPFFTFMALISNETMSKGCGGSLIHPNWVLTAAHCFDLAPKQVILYFGFDHFFDLSEYGRTERVVSPENFFLHPLYDSNFIRNDIALIQLPIPVESSDFIHPIEISEYRSVSRLIDGIVIGKGRQEYDGSHSNVTHYAPMRAATIFECLTAYPELQDRSTVFCASGVNGESTCYGKKIINSKLNMNTENCKIFFQVIPADP